MFNYNCFSCDGRGRSRSAGVTGATGPTGSTGVTGASGLTNYERSR